MSKTVSMRDIAKQMNVSTVSVSKALTDKDGVSEDLRAAIKKKATEMGYHYTSFGKKQSNEKSDTVGVVIASHYVQMGTSAFYLRMYQSIVMCLQKYNYLGVLEIVTDSMRETAVLPSILSEGKVGGVIVLGQMKTEYLSLIKETGIPLVYLDFYDRNMEVSSVITDSVYGSYMLTNYVISMGHKKIAYVGNIHATASILDRYLGYYRSLLVHGIDLREDYVISDRGENGILREPKLPDDMPTAFVCNCDEVAYMLMEKLKKMGYRIPEDISVVGFDNYTFADYSSPKLTTIEVNVSAMTDVAVDELNKQMSGQYEEGSTWRRVVSGKLIIRDSVAKIAVLK